MPPAFPEMTIGFALLAFAFATGLPLLCALIAVANVKRFRVNALICDPSMVPSDVRRRIAPWLNRLGHFGFKQMQTTRLTSAGLAEGFRWIMVNAEEKTYATIEWTVPISGSGPRVSLSLFSPLRSGTLLVTLDRRITRHPPAWWDDVQKHFGTVTAQWKHHYSRIRGNKERILPELDKFTDMLAADEEARHEALLKGGEFVSTRQDPDILRLRYSRLGSRLLPALSDLFRGRYFGSTSKRDVAAPAKAKVEERERIGGAIGLSMTQAVEQDLTRYRALISVRSSPLDHLRRIVALGATIAFFIFVFGRDEPLQTAVTILILAALHEAGHWLPMRIFGYRGISPIFIPFTGSTERARKLHASPWQQLIVLLGGPLPGLIAGLAMLAHGYFYPDTPLWLIDAAGMAVALNALHLLPVLPMDGGKIIDLLVFRDLPFLRPFFTVTASLSAFIVAIFLKSRVLRYIAMAMFGGVLWDVRTIQVVRGARRLPWAGELNDESEALRRIFRGLREEGQGSFIGSEHWHKKIEALLMEVMRKRPRMSTRLAGGSILTIAGAIPTLLLIGVLLGPVLGDAGRVVKTAGHVTEFRIAFPKETGSIAEDEKIAFVDLASETQRNADGTPINILTNPGEAAEALLPILGPRLDKIDWSKARTAARTNVISAPVLPIWVELQCQQMENASDDNQFAEAQQRAGEMLEVLTAIEPATSLQHRKLYSQIELRVLQLVEHEAAAGRLDSVSLASFERRISERYKAPIPEVENLLVVAEWAERTRISAIEDATAQASLDPRFWRDLYPRIRTVRKLLAEQNSDREPSSVALARLWKATRRVGEIPPVIGKDVSIAPGEANLIINFCEGHRELTWRRLAALSALRLETYRQKEGKFPPMWKHNLPGGAVIELVSKPGPQLMLTDRREQMERRVPIWLTPPTLPKPEVGTSLDYNCPLFGSTSLPALSSSN